MKHAIHFLAALALTGSALAAHANPGIDPPMVTPIDPPAMTVDGIDPPFMLDGIDPPFASDDIDPPFV